MKKQVRKDKLFKDLYSYTQRQGGRFASCCEDVYYAIDNGKLAGITKVIGYALLTDFTTFREHIEVCKFLEKFGLGHSNKYMDRVVAERALANLHKNDADICFIAVNPNLQGRGVGTRMVRSINENLEFFSGNEATNVCSCQIHKKNIASKKIFQRNNFKRLRENEAVLIDYYNVKE
jgi:ribosomal protein S18 acetylase RimI-like enzyme